MKKHNRRARRKFAQKVRKHLGDSYRFVSVPDITMFMDELKFYEVSKDFTSCDFADSFKRIIDIHPFKRSDIERDIHESTRLVHIEKFRNRINGLSNRAIEREDRRLDRIILKKVEQYILDQEFLKSHVQLPTFGGFWVDVKKPTQG
tara:strand:- start:187 stop:627 length:441 start_codon:yes stop_codon:yes gene_type:complete